MGWRATSITQINNSDNKCITTILLQNSDHCNLGSCGCNSCVGTPIGQLWGWLKNVTLHSQLGIYIKKLKGVGWN